MQMHSQFHSKALHITAEERRAGKKTNQNKTKTTKQKTAVAQFCKNECYQN